MNQRQKEEYLREYGILKSEGKPFFPYAVAKDSLMACIVMAVIILASLTLGVELGAKAKARSRDFSWRQSADAMRTVLESVHSGGRVSGVI